MKNWIVTLLILISSLTYSQEKIKTQIKIPFTLTQSGHIVIAAEVNGIKGNFILDTGAGINLLTKDFADKIADFGGSWTFIISFVVFIICYTSSYNIVADICGVFVECQAEVMR